MGIPGLTGAKPRVFMIHSGKEPSLIAGRHMKEEVSARGQAPHKIRETGLWVVEMFEDIYAIDHLKGTGGRQRSEVTRDQPQIGDKVFGKNEPQVNAQKTP
jgi:hypothetical protein